MAGEILTRRGTTAGIQGVTPLGGELLLNIDDLALHVGDGAQVGGWIINSGNVVQSTNSSSITIHQGDQGKITIMTNTSGSIAVGLPQAIDANNFGNGKGLYLLNLGSVATITPTTSQINGAAAITLTYGQLARIMSDGINYWCSTTSVITGQRQGTSTNDDATAGNVGEFIYSLSTGSTATITVAIASPAVVSWTAHGLQAGSVVTFTTTGALPTGITAGAPYYILDTGLTTNTFEISATPFGSAVNTSGTQSGTHTGTSQITLTNSAQVYNLGAIKVTAGDWDISGAAFVGAPGTSATHWAAGINLTSASAPTLSPVISAGFGPFEAFNNSSGLPNGEILTLVRGRLSVNTTTIVYLIASENYTGTAPIANGQISARRVR